MNPAYSNFRIGCSGYHYPEWKHVFYPKGLAQKKWFDFYSRHFNTIELNVTFYRFPQLAFLRTWCLASPDSFSFSLKVPRAITHYKRFNGTERMLADFYGTTRMGLQDKLGAILFQLPSRMIYNDELLNRIIQSIDPSFCNVIEFRHISWWKKEVYNTLSKHQIIFCGASHPELPDEVIVNADTAYYRFHGVPRLYKSSYPKKKLEAIADSILHKKKLKQVYLYFNNTAGTAAIRNAKYMQSYLSSNAEY